jgi:hypothetical protein
MSRYDRRDLVQDREDLLAQSKEGSLTNPFREPLGMAHSGWSPKQRGEKAEEGEPSRE